MLGIGAPWERIQEGIKKVIPFSTNTILPYFQKNRITYRDVDEMR